MINLPFLKWEMRRNALLYALFFLFTVIGLAAVLLFISYEKNWENHPFFYVGAIIALFWGAGVFTREFRQGNIMEFLLARPVSREEFLNTIIMAGALPMVLLMFLPFIYALALISWTEIDIPLYQLALSDLLAAIWILLIFIIGILLGLFLQSSKFSRYERAVQAFVLSFLVAIFMNLQIITKEFSWANPSWMAANRPFVSFAVSLFVLYALYRLCLRRMKRMDI